MENKNLKHIAMTGGTASGEALRQINPDVMPVYPITPQTPIIISFAKYHAKKKVDTELITVESEHSAMSAAIGASAAGARTVTATSSQGLALMNEMLYIASGMQLPIFMLVSARALSAPLNIHGDHSDVMSVRDTGWVQIFSENAQESYDNTLIGMKLAEESLMPVMVIMDGFITSHSVETLSILSNEVVKKFVGKYKAKNALLDYNKPVTYGALALPNVYFDFKIDQEQALQNVAAHYKKVAHEFEKISGRFHDYFESYYAEEADQVIVVAGSAAGTAKDVVDAMRKDGKNVGLLKIKMFRPFPHEEIVHLLQHVKNIAVFDRAMASGTYPPIYSDILAALHNFSDNKHNISSYVYGLGGRDISKEQIEEVFENLIKNKENKKISYIGVN